MGYFQKLKVWQKAKDLAVFVYRLTATGAWVKDHGLRDQMRRAVVSISSNIAEGDELNTDKQSVHYFYMAKGSSAELLTQAIIANEIGYLSEQDFEHLISEGRSISAMLSKLIQARSKSNKGK